MGNKIPKDIEEPQKQYFSSHFSYGQLNVASFSKMTKI
jgi:hypothetical protein